MADEPDLAARIRAALSALSAQPSVREVKMFGGLSFMVDEKLAVSVHKDGDLLVRADPDRAEELLGITGARPAEMGAGRPMNGGWISVGDEAISTDDDLDFWIGVALAYNESAAGRPGRGRPRPR